MIRNVLLAAGAAGFVFVLAGSAEAQQPSPVFVDVDCDAGGRINDALLKTVQERHVVLRVSGVCLESVAIRRDDVQLQGRPGAAIRADASHEHALSVNGGRRISVWNLTLQGGYRAALFVASGDFDGQQLTIESAKAGIGAHNSNISLSETSIRGNAFEGVFATDSTVSLAFCRIYKNRSYGVWAQHSRVSLYDTEIADNSTGVAADGLSLVSTAGHYVRIQNNELGVRLKLNSVGWHAGALPTVSNNITDFDIDASSEW